MLSTPEGPTRMRPNGGCCRRQDSEAVRFRQELRCYPINWEYSLITNVEKWMFCFIMLRNVTENRHVIVIGALIRKLSDKIL